MAITKIKALGVTANTITASQIANDTITNTQINSSAAIDFSKLTGVTNGITEADEWRFNTNPNNHHHIKKHDFLNLNI